MMRRLNLIIALFVCLSWNGRAAAQLTVSDWSLSTAVQDLSSGGGQDTRRFNTVINPFQDSHSAALGPGTATTSYNFSWSGDHASFRIDAAHVDPDLGNDFYRTLSQGTLNFTTTAPLRAHFTGAYTYFLPVPAADVATSFLLRDTTTNVRLINQTGLNDTFVHPPPLTGSFAWDQTAILPAGHTFLIIYDMQLITSQNSGLLATGNGYFQLTLEPVPEPATLILSSVAIALCIHRSRCRSNKTSHAPASAPPRHSVRT